MHPLKETLESWGTPRKDIFSSASLRRDNRRNRQPETSLPAPQHTHRAEWEVRKNKGLRRKPGEKNQELPDLLSDMFCFRHLPRFLSPGPAAVLLAANVSQLCPSPETCYLPVRATWLRDVCAVAQNPVAECWPAANSTPILVKKPSPLASRQYNSLVPLILPNSIWDEL